MNICFVIATLTSGGAERVASVLCNHWARAGHKVTILTFAKEGSKPHYLLDTNITLKQLNLLSLNHSVPNYVYENLLRIIRLRREFRNINPDVIISFMLTANILNIFASAYSGIPLIISDRVHPGYHDFGRLRESLRSLTYKYADRIVVQTGEVSKWIMDNLKIQSYVIPNPVDLDYFTHQGKGHGDNGEKYIVAAGRLDRQKGHDLLIQSFAGLQDKYPEWKVLIYGHGPDRELLTRRIKEFRLEDRIFLKGIIQDIREALDIASIFVLSSRYEGFPNVLVEALAYGCCVIGTDSPGATRELLDDGKYGRLVGNENISQLTESLDELMSRADKRQEYEKRAREAVLDLSKEKIGEIWLSLMRECVGPVN